LNVDTQRLQEALEDFARERDWNQFHSPKNLAMALSVEASELLEHFQWLTPEQSADLDTATRDEVAEEIADVQIYLLRLADKLSIDLETAVQEKMEKNREKYPADTVRGSAAKYTRYR
jgi:NTP pyrophosphatase (non-canonical NTP hydrolase)